MSSLKRRLLLKYGMAATGGLLMLRRGGIARAVVGECTFRPGSAPTLRGADIPKYTRPLLIPPVMPKAPWRRGHSALVDHYEIAVRQLEQHVLPPELGLPPTTVWGYGSIHHPESFSYPGHTIEARWRRSVCVKWINELKDLRTGRFLPHLFAVDPTLHWANPPGGLEGRDGRSVVRGHCPPGPYRGPVPIVTHLHGSTPVEQESDGFPEAWYLPAARNIPDGYAKTGTFFDYFQRTSRLGHLWEPGAAVFQYYNRQRPTTLWYHDHSLGLTRLNTQAGLAGLYIIRGGPQDLPKGVLPGPPPGPYDCPGAKVYEVPLVIQDRSFNDDGSLFYPDSRGLPPELAEDVYVPNGPVAPIWVPEFNGNTIVVNGRTWPYLEVEQRRYRFRILNGSNERLLILALSNGHPIWQIGSDGGFVPAPVPLQTLLMGPAERNDVIIDFSRVPAGTEVLLLNVGPELHGDMSTVADPETTGQVMQFRVVRATSRDTSVPPERLVLPEFEPLGDEEAIRRVSLSEEMLPGVGAVRLLLGTVEPSGDRPRPLHWDHPITETPAVGSTEIWELYNFTEEAHPIHLHDVQFQVVERQPFDGSPTRPPAAWETGYKDTVGALPGEITRIRVKFPNAGLFVWHCHILEHEDNEMMRPYHIGPIPGDLPMR
ncbi:MULTISPECIES: multicopper oxidase family protein [Sorangium]|uniref:Bilirubin oxidase n=1 Tax=Sorangium cellulosum TaxID=56 RepID=A0A4P2QXV6_SORCE|nr:MULTISPECIES: multicopper oxidase [Sorangium]AUX35394.1 bilirubin oxidase [Sorangium cellulosum]WCQ94697.1 Spore coat protein A [Sorangium sp. Soce836]